MSGLFKKLLRGKKKTPLDLDPDANDDLWTEHEVTDEIHEVDSSGSKQAAEPPTASSSRFESPAGTGSDPESAVSGITTDAIQIASDFTEDPLDTVTLQIQAEIEAEKQKNSKLEKLRRLKEATDQFKRPDWADDFIDPDAKN